MRQHLLIALALFAASVPAQAHDPNAGHKMPVAGKSETAPGLETIHIADARVIDQNGAERRFGEVVGDGPVVVTFIYTSCTTICPVANGIFQIVQEDLDAAGDDRTRLVSVSIDPVRDSPAALHRTADAFEAKDRWTFVTGSVPEIADVLRSFGLSLGSVEDHDPMFLVGSGNGRFVRIAGLPAPETLLGTLARVEGR
ncbi:SCO family protein [Silicimonas algicola]|uniref:Protein SCO1/2 n=1 Tax=Silicimonas algicola TaxID=1826607 RepID=A0A316G1B1_9RHOB|nr:SCO family protein [Silicimonas algicola]PWK54639.1 protein SCO1/2 [Silicimonas algicola]